MSDWNISLDRVEHTGKGRAFVLKSDRNRIDGVRRQYGALQHCVLCRAVFFRPDNRENTHCTQECVRKAQSLHEYKGINRASYSGNLNWAYVAGFFDGEGTVQGTCNSSRGVRISFAQKNKDVLEEIQKFLLSEGISTYISYKVSRATAHRKEAEGHLLGFGNRYAVYKFIMKVRTYSFVKFDALCDAGIYLWTMIEKRSADAPSIFGLRVGDRVRVSCGDSGKITNIQRLPPKL